MAKAPTSVIGIDMGRYALKSVLMHRRGEDQFVISHHAMRPLREPAENSDSLAQEVKGLLKEMGGSAKSCCLAISSADLLMRIIEQPETPPELLREALRLNGMSMLNQDCRDFILDCDLIPSAEPPMPAEPGVPVRHKYVVGGVPRTQVENAAQAIQTANATVNVLQLAPVSLFNAFEFAKPDIFNHEAFFLVDFGHTTSTMILGAKRELVLVRTIDFGGTSLLDALALESGESREGVISGLEQEDELMIENARVALSMIAREVGSSIGFFEGRREETIRRIFMSGGVAKSHALLKILSEELHMPCETWSAVERCEVNSNGRFAIDPNGNGLELNVACGAAAELLTAE